LKDETGGRRFWPVKCGRIDIADLVRDRDQLWAEARVRFKAGDRWWLDDKALIESAAEEVHARYEGDPWDDLIAEWLNNPSERYDQSGHPLGTLTSTSESVTIAEVLLHCIGKRQDTWTQADQNRVARSLTAKGWKRKLKRTGADREWRYFAPVTSMSVVTS
jgi:predicted P-loop ATPase